MKPESSAPISGRKISSATKTAMILGALDQRRLLDLGQGLQQADGDAHQQAHEQDRRGRAGWSSQIASRPTSSTSDPFMAAPPSPESKSPGSAVSAGPMVNAR